MKLLEAEANSGSEEAQLALGNLYGYGQGVPVNYAKAVFWTRKAAAQGNAEAEFNLGTMYASGLGGLQVDYVKACALMNLAVRQNKKYEEYRYNLISMEMTVDQVRAAKVLSDEMIKAGSIQALDREKGV
ncbi:hypothetical protein GCM10027285_20740 [Oleiagrimonas citrea]|uniref:Sel1 repeat family protein n=1 Tax=Oleiagrimonas citrea TaxID=1665687 RepID=A0A846ZJB2_9GAMM|nr:tetratricopeptide repeat protein [Oleiagrimonas citrea]NKZ37610.1 sel1 repeat family protein [Oleiagrimonas citrea]